MSIFQKWRNLRLKESRVLYRIKENKSLLGHTVIKLETIKENLKICQRGKVAWHQTADFSRAAARRQGNEILGAERKGGVRTQANSFGGLLPGLPGGNPRRMPVSRGRRVQQTGLATRRGPSGISTHSK